MVEQMIGRPPKPGASRQCQANRHCAMEGPSFALPVVSVGRPDGRLTAGCEVCGVFACGGCAKREPLRLRVGGIELFAWRLACALCGSALGDTGPRRAVLHSALFGPLAALDTLAAPWRLEDEAALDALKQAVKHHDDRALRLLYVFNTQVSAAGAIRLSETAVEESPGEGVAWFYKALLCAKAGHAIASRHAFKELSALTDDTDGDARPGLPALRHLGLGPDDARHDPARLDELSKRLTDYAERLAERAGKLFNPELARHDAAIRSYWEGDVRLTDVVKHLFPEEARMTPAVRTFVAAYELELSLRLPEIESERGRFITHLAHVLEEEELRVLVAKTLAQRLGSISHNDYYAHMRQLAEANEVSLASFPALEGYFQYLSISSSIEPETFQGDLWDRIRAGYTERAETAEERLLIEETSRVRLIAHLLDYCRGRLGVARIQETYAPRPGAFRELVKEFKAEAEKAQRPSFWRRLIPPGGLWRRLFSKRRKS